MKKAQVFWTWTVLQCCILIYNICQIKQCHLVHLFGKCPKLCVSGFKYFSCLPQTFRGHDPSLTYSYFVQMGGDFPATTCSMSIFIYKYIYTHWFVAFHRNSIPHIGSVSKLDRKEVSKGLISGLEPQYTPFISIGYSPFTHHLLISWAIQVVSCSPCFFSPQASMMQPIKLNTFRLLRRSYATNDGLGILTQTKLFLKF